MLKKTAKFAAILGVIGYFGFCGAVYCFPELFFYAPSSEKSDLAKAKADGFNAEEVTYKSADGTELYGWYVKPSSKDKIIVFFHGNAYNIEAFYHKLIPFIKAGYGAFIGEYRGFGGIKGDSMQKNLGDDAVAAVKYLQGEGWRNKDMILYGMSLGSYTSSYVVHTLGRQDSFAALILEVPFDSVYNVVRQRFWPVFPFDLIIKDRYDNTELLAETNLPVLVHIASKDKVVPPERAKKLFWSLPNRKEMEVYQGAGHSELYDYKNWQDILTWLEKNEKTE